VDSLRDRVLSALDALLAVRQARVRVLESLFISRKGQASLEDPGDLISTTDAVVDLEARLWGTFSESVIDDWLSLSEARAFGDGLLYTRAGGGIGQEQQRQSALSAAGLDEVLWSVKDDRGVRESGADLFGPASKLIWLRVALEDESCTLNAISADFDALEVEADIPAALTSAPEQTLLTEPAGMCVRISITGGIIRRLRLFPGLAESSINLEALFSGFGRSVSLERPAPEACRPRLAPISTRISEIKLHSRRWLSLEVGGQIETVNLFWSPEEPRYPYSPINVGQLLRLYARPYQTCQGSEQEEPDEEEPDEEEPDEEEPDEEVPGRSSEQRPTLHLIHLETIEGLELGGILSDVDRFREDGFLDYLKGDAIFWGTTAKVVSVEIRFESAEINFADDLGVSEPLRLSPWSRIRSVGLEAGQEVVVYRHWSDDQIEIERIERGGQQIYSCWDR
jgi:hypothetical protein